MDEEHGEYNGQKPARELATSLLSPGEHVSLD